MKPYRTYGTFMGLWITILILFWWGGVAAFMILFPQQARSDPWKFVLAVVVVVPMFAVLYGLDRRILQRRIHGIGEVLKTRAYRFRIIRRYRSALVGFAPVEHLEEWAGLKGGASGVRWIANAKQRRLIVFEHGPRLSIDKSTDLQTNTFVCWHSTLLESELARLAVLSSLTMICPSRKEERRIQNVGPRLKTGDDRFDRRWVVLGDEEVLEQFLTPSTREALLHSPVGERWFLGGGWVCCSIYGALDGQNLMRFLDNAKALVREVPGAEKREPAKKSDIV